MSDDRWEKAEAPEIPNIGGYRIWCWRCKDTGTMLAIHREQKGAPSAFRCQCQRGQYSRRSFPVWNGGLEKIYQVVD